MAATQSARGCRTVTGALFGARALAQAGATLAQSGDYQRALSLLGSAQARLTSIDPSAPEAATARNYLELVQNVISAIDRVAQSSM